MVFRALVEAAAFGARRILERFREWNVSTDSVTAVGGIAGKSAFVMQVCTDVLNLPIRTVKSDQVCALGAAMLAAAASKVHPNLRTAMDRMNSGYGREYLPNPENVRIYDHAYGRYLAYSDAVESVVVRKA